MKKPKMKYDETTLELRRAMEMRSNQCMTIAKMDAEKIERDKQDLRRRIAMYDSLLAEALAAERTLVLCVSRIRALGFSYKPLAWSMLIDQQST